jgi:hypothetical protein
MKSVAADVAVRIVRVVGLSAVLGVAVGTASAQTPTYQGMLQSAGQSASGAYDMRLSLYTAATGGSPLQTISKTGVEVSGGVFAVPMDFDPQLFAGDPKYIGIEVRQVGSGIYTEITPRQPIGAAPVALSVPGIVSVPNLTPDQDIAIEATATGGLSGSAWQSFTCTATGRLRSVTLKLNNIFSGSSTSVTATVVDGEGTSGAALGASTAGVPGTSGSPTFVTFNFSPGIAVNAGEKLTLRLSNNGFVNWYISATDWYAGGRSSVSATQDFAMASFVEVAGSVPSISVPGGLSVDDLTLGAYQGGTVGSAVASFPKQLTLGGAFNTPPNSGNSVKLLIADYDNDSGANIYPIYVEDENNNIDFFVRKQGGGATGTTTGFLNGNLGLGDSTPNARLHVSTGAVSSSGFQALFTNSAVSNNAFNTTGMRVTNDGFFEITNNANTGAGATLARLSGLGTWTATSDARLKTDITPAEGLLDAALRLRPVRFRWKSSGTQDTGLIAQEVRQVLPAFVIGDEDYEMLTVDYSHLAVVAIGAVQEQQAMIERLRNENSELRQRLERIESALRNAAATK